ncbi:unnamed protein product [Caenorhabditis auriculariae]|uniref:HotDog ACOT-type domain-containing protein n=1 Tax=Caenorhabditis auriculariae TaxID=2777116 RepID=A0A8S1GZ12_9PELO|nr:unnamed protein product [Caenorhabditis auriculariae]
MLKGLGSRLISGRLCHSSPNVRTSFVNPKSSSTLSLSAIPTVEEMTSKLIEHLKMSKIENFNEHQLQSKKLASRRMTDSYRQFRVPLSTDSNRGKLYLSASNNIRMGKLLEDLDHLAVFVSYAHNAEDANIEAPGTLPRTIVTASVPRIDFHRENLHPGRDIIMDGQVTWAGTSSLEVLMRVARNPSDNNKKMRVHSLAASCPDEAALINDALEAMKTRNRSKGKVSPTNSELRMIHDIYEEFLRRNPNTWLPVLTKKEMWLHQTQLSMTDLCFPESQNMYGKIFGGFLMRKALELAHTNAKLFCKGHVVIRAMDDIVFVKPVEIGNVLHLDSYITYTENEYVQVIVRASVTNIIKSAETKINPCESRTTTNVFHFTIESCDSSELPIILPKHYAHTSMYIEGRRHLHNSVRRMLSQRKPPSESQ